MWLTFSKERSARVVTRDLARFNAVACSRNEEPVGIRETAKNPVQHTSRFILHQGPFTVRPFARRVPRLSTPL